MDHIQKYLKPKNRYEILRKLLSKEEDLEYYFEFINGNIHVLNKELVKELVQAFPGLKLYFQKFLITTAEKNNFELFKYFHDQCHVVSYETLLTSLMHAVRFANRNIIEYIYDNHNIAINNIYDINEVCLTPASRYFSDEEFLDYIIFLVEKCGLKPKLFLRTENIGEDKLNGFIHLISRNHYKSLEYLIRYNKHVLPQLLSVAHQKGRNEIFNLILSKIKKK